MKIRNRFPELGTDHPAVVAEMDAICAAGLAEGMIVLGKMVTGIRTEMGVNPEADKGSLIGSIVPYVLGITMENPIENGQLDSTLANAAEIKTPLQVKLYFDNEVRNKVVEWVKANNFGTVTACLGQPIVKLPNVVAEFKKWSRMLIFNIFWNNKKAMKKVASTAFVPLWFWIQWALMVNGQ